jgi:hypothetical protein
MDGSKRMVVAGSAIGPALPVRAHGGGRDTREYAKGRRLWVGTANLDARRPVIRDLGAVAATGGPDAPELFRNVLLASRPITDRSPRRSSIAKR